MAENKIVMSIDSKNGLIAIQGWLEKTEISAVDLTNILKSRGVKHFIYTDIERDGTLQGINVYRIQSFLQQTGVMVFIAGGISTQEDIYQLKQVNTGIEGIILGKALYSGALNFEDVQKILQEE
jgi:phosphoribosylformimino-5-aminoimidazole carboxamide ribotide isomerase